MGKDTSWKARANDRRNSRQNKDEDVRPTNPNKKDTIKWCKGKVGKEHTPKCMPTKPIGHIIPETWRDLVCTKCGKILDKYYPINFGIKNTPKPDWVID